MWRAIFWFFIFGHLVCVAQRKNLVHISSEDGLSQSNVICTLQDSRHLMWFGTYDGLNIYDGYKFTVFKHTAYDTTTIRNNAINSISEDIQGDLWIGTGEGISFWHRATGKFNNFYNHPLLGKIGNSYTHCDREGFVWIGSGDGQLFSVDSRNQAVDFLLALKDKAGNPCRVTAILRDTNHALWVGTENNGIAKINPSSKTITWFTADENDDTTLSDNYVSAIIEGQDDVWIGTFRSGLNRIKKDGTSCVRYTFTKRKGDDPSPNWIASLGFYQGKILVGSASGQIFELDAGTGKYRNFLAQDFGPELRIDNYITSLFVDNCNSVWIGGNGIYRIDQSPYNFKNHMASPATHTEARMIWSIHEDKTLQLWVGTSEGLRKLDKATGAHVLFNLPGESKQPRVLSIFEDSDGNMYVGTYGAGLFIVDPSRTKIRRFSHNARDSTSLSNNDVFVCYEDITGQIWVGTWNGLNKFHKSTSTFTRYYGKGDSSLIASSSVYCIKGDSQHNLYIGTTGGLSRLSLLKNTATHYRHDVNDNNSLSNNFVTCMYIDSLDNVWIGTGGGLNLLDVKTQEFRNYDERHGLVNNFIYGILDDDRNNLWLSTNKGIVRFNRSTAAMKTFDKSHNLSALEFNQNAYFKSQSGEMYFGNPNGLNAFRPEEILDYECTGNLVVSDFLLGEKSVLSDSNSIIKSEIHELKEITLPYDYKNIAFEFAALSYFQNEKNQYAYKLEGWDEAWNFLGNRRTVTFTNLDPGKYTLRVKAANGDQKWFSKELEIKINIIPPFWQTWWFKAALTATVLFAIYKIFRLRARASARKHQILEDLVRERTRGIIVEKVKVDDQKNKIELQNEMLLVLNNEKNEFIEMIAHDVKSPVGAIQFCSNMLRKDLGAGMNQETLDYLDAIDKSTSRISALVVNLLKRRSDELEPKQLVSTPPVNIMQLLYDSIKDFELQADEKDIRMHYQENERPVLISADPTVLRQIFDNLISNAIKYSPFNRNIFIRTTTIDGAFLFEVQDEGPGLSAEDLKNLFNKFTRLSSVPTLNESSTGLGLYITKKLVEQLNGKIWCTSTIKQGAIFRFKLPLDSE
jgi:signal transduction histidine kinase/ligand-binding sensor domain-containing protein